MKTSVHGLRSRSVDLLIMAVALLVAGFAIHLPALWAIAALAFAACGVLRASASLVQAAGEP